MRAKTAIMYQVYVTDTDLGHEVPIGPRMDVQEALLGLVERTNVAIAKGQVRGWKDAHIVTLASPN